jgi:hypothetical protein
MAAYAIIRVKIKSVLLVAIRIDADSALGINVEALIA